MCAWGRSVFVRNAWKTLFALAVLPGAALAQLAVEPAGWHSTLPVTPQVYNPVTQMLEANPDRRPILDSEFADMVKSQLIRNGNSNVKDAKFIFQECYGGGMLDDLDSSLDATVKWVGGSASRWNQTSIGQVSRNENDVRREQGLRPYAPQYQSGGPPLNFWTSALITQLSTPPGPERPLLDSINNATAADLVGPNAVPPLTRDETGQSISRAGGDAITLKDNDAVSHHAILWAGNPDASRHFFNIAAVREQLIDAWGQPDGVNVTITILFGNGATAPDPAPGDPNRTVNLPAAWNAMAATRDNLDTVLADLNLNPNEQFFFYATDHGGKRVVPAGAPAAVAPGDSDIETFDLAQGILTGMMRTDDNVPILDLIYSGVTVVGSVAVMLNNSLLGYLDPALSEMEFSLSESLLQLSNEIRVVNNGLSSILIQEKFFDTGSINDNPPTAVPEPATCALLLFGGGIALILRRGRRKT